jgi:hypothetical protein
MASVIAIQMACIVLGTLRTTMTWIISNFRLFVSPLPLISIDNWGFNIFQRRNVLEILPLFKCCSMFIYNIFQWIKVASVVTFDVKTS